MKRLPLVFLFFTVLIVSCRLGRISTQNLAYLYDKSMYPYIPEYVVFHKDDTISTIYFTVHSGSLLYMKLTEEEKFTAKFSLKAELYDSYEMKTLLDSSEVILRDTNPENNTIISTLDIRTKQRGFSLLRLIFTDMNKHTIVESYFHVNRNSPNTEQNYLMLDTDSLPFFKHWVSAQQEFRIVSNNKKTEKLFVRYYNRNFPVAAPPYSMYNEKPYSFTADSIFIVPLTNGSTELLRFAKKGIYHFQADTSVKEGYSVLRFDESFPGVTRPEQMLYPLRYLTQKDEYNDMMIGKNKKEAIDRFWIETAGTAERAKEFIKMYYNRVQSANLYFTSYLEGWKSDRGIIYIVYGPPNVVYYGKDSESWIYGEDRNMLSITFTFYKVENPFSDNDYSLSRSPAYKEGWYMAVENWRR